jgi:hypothetical protein
VTPLIWFGYFIYLRIDSFLHSLHKDKNFSERKTQYIVIIIIIIIIIIKYGLVCEQTICFIVLEAKIILCNNFVLSIF